MIINFTIKLDSGVLLLAKHRALLERTSVNRYLADVLEDYADGTMNAARRTNSAAYVFGVVEEVRRLKRTAKAARIRPVDLRHVDVEGPPPAGEVRLRQAPYVQHDRTTAREHDRTPEG